MMTGSVWTGSRQYHCKESTEDMMVASSLNGTVITFGVLWTNGFYDYTNCIGIPHGVVWCVA